METVPVETLVLDPGNVREHPTANLEAIKASLTRFGQQKAIVVDRDNRVIAGNGTVLAARALAWPSLRVERSELLGEEAVAYAIADNRTTDLGVFNQQALAATLQSLGELEGTGFDEGALDDLLAGLSSGNEIQGDPDAIPDPPKTPVTQPGDLWLLGDHRLLCGDATKPADYDCLLQGHTADLCLTDPPYGVGIDYSERTNDTVEAIGVLIDAFMPLVRARSTRALVASGQRMLWRYPRADWLLGWALNTGLGMSPWGFVCWHPALAYGTDPYLAVGLGSRPDTYFGGSEAHSSEEHPVAKPIKWWSWLMERGSAHPRERILDPFAGSGTTLIAAHQLGRTAYLMEIEPTYCDVICARFEQATGLTPRRAT